MKNLILAIFLCFSFFAFAQSGPQIKETFQKIKSQTAIDANDKTVYDLMDEFYQKSLQADDDEMTPETVHKIEKTFSDPNTKNLHLLFLFLMYQQHISQTVMAGRPSNPEFQIETMTLLENEAKSVYGKIPAIIYIYKTEALDAGQKKVEAQATVTSGLKEYPDSIPLKVYGYLHTKDEVLKKDLIKNHPHHWMVQQFGIQ
ncbi:hypothetical protein [Chryseobacterium sp. Mn2064]|uniref:hypothetical protein n=1 Tax=Chryseobacterium sp. Mn2064 TaxID=3395263 RepID=UPI003BBF4024